MTTRYSDGRGGTYGAVIELSNPAPDRGGHDPQALAASGKQPKNRIRCRGCGQRFYAHAEPGQVTPCPRCGRPVRVRGRNPQRAAS